MRKAVTAASILAFVLAAASFGQAAQITGDYIESRGADVYTGPCFANAEVGLVGDQAILAWKVREGSWEGVRLDGLAVVAAVRASSTLGDTYSSPYPARAVIIVDERANRSQRDALVGFARSMTGDLLSTIAKVETSPISFDVSNEEGHYSRAVLHAGSIAGIETRSIAARDHICGNEETFYPPLAKLSHAMPAVATLDEFKGDGLGVSWSMHDKRSAFVGFFAR